MVNLKSYIKALLISWIKRFLTKSDKWTLFKIPDIFSYCGANQVKSIGLIDNPFWKNVAMAWSEYNNICEPNSTEEMLNEPLWFNLHIKVSYIKSWHQSGLILVKNLFINYFVL
jgi:hypothetical protein